ncbi:MAG: TspO/MBR family protein [Sphingomonadaceae bacterium]|nr:TspO/MBR family protein [Sphingomonadaceae bacterium]
MSSVHNISRQRSGLSPFAAALAVGGALAAAGIVSARYSPNPANRRIWRWYRRLEQPAAKPPDVVFGGVWPVLLAGLGYGAWRLLQRPPAPARNAAVALAGTTLGLVVYYSKLTFGDRRLSAGVAESAALVTTAAAFSLTAAREDRIAALTAVPLTVWSSFGGWLTNELARKNPRLDADQTPAAAPAAASLRAAEPG